jgi:hypothetical protein
MRIVSKVAAAWQRRLHVPKPRDDRREQYDEDQCGQYKGPPDDLENTLRPLFRNIPEKGTKSSSGQ